MSKPMQVPAVVRKEFDATLDKYENDLTAELVAIGKLSKKVNYRKLAFAHYAEKHGQIACAHCGFGIRDVLEVAHLDCDRSNNEVSNLAILCPNCHKMHDLDLISTATILVMRDRPKVVVQAKRMKDAGKKALATRRAGIEKKKRQAAAKKAVETRRIGQNGLT